MASRYLMIGSCVAATAAAYTGVATFSGNGPTGTVTFIQEAAGQPTKIQVDLQNIHGHNSWFVNAFPVMDDCSVNSIGPSFDPTGSTAALPCAKGAACRVGDLEGKHGWLNGSHAKTVVMDDSISLVGQHSIMYRSVLLGSQNGSRYACATIKDHSPLTVLKAEFRAPQPVIGDIYFMQDKDKPDSQATILMDLVLANGSALHNASYHVHEGSLSTNHSCDAAGKHFNPSSGAACTKEGANWATCEIGDLSGRHGAISLPVTQGGKRMLSDPLLPLSGPNSIEKRSILIHGDKGKHLACAPITATQTPFKDAFEHQPFTVHTPAKRNLRQV